MELLACFTEGRRCLKDLSVRWSMDLGTCLCWGSQGLPELTLDLACSEGVGLWAKGCAHARNTVRSTNRQAPLTGARPQAW